MQKKRITAAIVTVILVLSSFAASAELVKAGYDTTDLDNIKVVYNEVIDGHYTSKVVWEDLPEEAIEWVAEGYELAYPHAGYDRLYLEGNAQQITRYNNLFPQWETRFVDCFWEVGNDLSWDAVAPAAHRIYQRQQTNVPGYGWVWDYSEDPTVDAKLLVPTNRYADVDYSFKAYGVGPFDLNGNFVSDEVMAMYNNFLAGYAADFNPASPSYKFQTDENNDISYGLLTPASLSALDADNQYVVSDEEIAAYVGGIQSKFVTGPAYPAGTTTKDVAAEYLAHHDEWPTATWQADTVRYGGTTIAWTEVDYQLSVPYDYYQFLIINGVVFDGSNDLPRIWRYTGGKATPNVEWKYAFAEEAYPFNIIEFKYVDGKPAYDWYTGEPIWRTTNEYANVYVKVTDTEIQAWLKDDVADAMIASVDRTSTIGSYFGYMGAGIEVAN